MTQTVAFKTEWDQLFIGGKWVEPSTSEVIEVHSPATGEYVWQSACICGLGPCPEIWAT